MYKTKPDNAIYDKCRAGLTYQAIANEYGLTRQRIEQIYRQQRQERGDYVTPRRSDYAMTDENIEKIISSDEARRLRQEIDKAIGNYASLFERQGLVARVGSGNEYLGHLTRAYGITATIAVGERKA